MKQKTILLALIIVSSPALWAQDAKTEKFKVAGNCGMCESRIEKAAGGLEGVQSAEWNKETKFLTVNFNPSQTGLHKIHKAVAEAGHDTEMHKADDEAYEGLPGCCKYKRMAEDKKGDQEKSSPHHH